MNNTVAEKLHAWAIQDLNLVSEGLLQEIPDAESFKCLTKGKDRRIWQYVVNHVRSASAVENVKRTLALKKLHDTQVTEFAVPFNTISQEVTKLETAVSKSSEKRTYFGQTLITVKERLLSTEKEISKLNDEINKTNQMAAFLEMLAIKYQNSNTSTKILLEQISSYLNHFRSYQSSYILSNQSSSSSAYGLIDCKLNSAIDYKFKEFVNIASAIVENRVAKQDIYNDILLATIQKKNFELKESGFLLNDLILYLRLCSDEDRQQFTAKNFQLNDLTKDLELNSQESYLGLKQRVSKMKYDFVHHSLCTLKNKNELSNLLATKDGALKDKIELLVHEVGSYDSELKITLFEKMIENHALGVSNLHLEENLNMISNNTEFFKQNCADRHSSDLKSNIENFYRHVYAIFYLYYNVPTVFQKVRDDLNDLQAYAQNMFSSQFPISHSMLTNLSSTYVLNRKLVWNFCNKSILIEPLKFEPYAFKDSLTPEVMKLLNFEPFENVGVACEKLIDLKQALKAKAKVYSKPYTNEYCLNTAEIYSKIMELLTNIKTYIDKGISCIEERSQDGHKNKILVQEWWEQNAQFVPKIEYEGKSLKMWIDILTILNDFAPSMP